MRISFVINNVMITTFGPRLFLLICDIKRSKNFTNELFASCIFSMKMFFVHLIFTLSSPFCTFRFLPIFTYKFKVLILTPTLT